MAEYDRSRFVPARAARQQSLELLTRFMGLFAQQDVAGMEKLLADDVVAYNDTDGRYHAAGIPVVGRSKVARFHAGIARLRAHERPRVSVRWMNGAPAVAVEFELEVADGLAPRFVTLGELDADGRVRRIYSVLAPAKLRALSPSGTGSPSSPRRRRRARRLAG